MVETKKGKMKTVRWEGKPFSVSVKEVVGCRETLVPYSRDTQLTEVDIPKIIDPLDAIVRLTSSAICGTDLHTYLGRLPMKHPLTFGHENMGIIEDVGDKVTTLNKGDRVLVGAGIGEITDFGKIGQGLLGEPLSYGISEYEPRAPMLDSSQARFMRVPFANANLLIFPPGDEHELDYLLLADIWLISWSGWSTLRLPSKSSRSNQGIQRRSGTRKTCKGKIIGAIPINFKDNDPVAQILKFEPNGVDIACDCVGFEAVDSSGKNIENLIITQALNVTRPSGSIWFIGVYVQEDNKPHKPDEATGIFPFPMGLWWAKGQTIKGGFVEPRPYQELLKTLIERGNVKPSFVFTKEFKIEDAPQAYKEFEAHKLIKAVFKFDTPKKA
ncbi:hypothetical protein L207DRAFT_579615 [Hyaloscypha variabilis F]|uniref:Alcohol dehydrogenase-like N-terminal domain-containing protein n=1 Tax=Hyaloscypha variabilis (strain UAMH 11265 / GT02V1 / F) TaxID=1149755 RepID=A0A2J6S1P4_HYAVF|nr:hypothetical protein L207DRAFT_579615 [Hyaloscypha variabilis F]